VRDDGKCFAPVDFFLKFHNGGKGKTNAKQDTSGKKPDFTKMAFTDIKWMKAEGNRSGSITNPVCTFSRA
jgi:hypothetical protein